jgi:NodT family efflux transporter outer membrane factor (OMF) lipoprotein
VLALTTGLAGCAQPERFQTAAIATPDTHLQHDPALSASAMPAKWWQQLHDPQLDRLMEQAMQDNIDLQLAATRVAASRAQAGMVESASQPQLGMQAGYSRNANSAHSPIVRLGASTRAYDLWQLGLQSSWELDLWGHLRQQQAAARASAQASAYGEEATRVAVLANVAQHYLLLRHNQRAASLNHQQWQLASQQAALTASRERNGLQSKAVVERADASLAQLQARQETLEQQSSSLLNALALLLGQPPGALDQQLGHAGALPLPPDTLPVGLPSTLARQRPDILQAEAQLHAAVAGVAAAEADFYPRLTLSGGLESLAFNGHDLGMWNARQFSFGPSLYLPLFNGGRLRQSLVLSQVQQQQAAIHYRQTVLNAWHEVDNAVQALHSTRAVLIQNTLALQQYGNNSRHARHAFEQGSSSKLEWLQAQSAELEVQMAQADARTAVSLSMVALYRALGGNWPTSATEAAHG